MAKTKLKVVEKKNEQKLAIEKLLGDIELFLLKYPQEIPNLSKAIKLIMEVKEEIIIKHLKEKES